MAPHEAAVDSAAAGVVAAVGIAEEDVAVSAAGEGEHRAAGAEGVAEVLPADAADAVAVAVAVAVAAE